LTETSFVPFRITVCGIEELGGFCEERVTHVLSILDPGTPPPPAFGTYGEHERVDLRFNDIIDEMPGMVLPGNEDVARILELAADLKRDTRHEEAHLLVHCQMGISRSTAAMTLILAHFRAERPAAEALAAVKEIRPRAWPNLRMIELGDRLLGRNGDLVDAVGAHYRSAVEAHPRLATSMADMGRAREIRAAGFSSVSEHLAGTDRIER
jgi:predicted protein tyrosine phosphatase